MNVIIIVAIIVATIALAALLKDRDVVRYFLGIRSPSKSKMFSFADIYDGATKTQTACHICGQVNTRRHCTEYGIGTVEEYYFCEKCGYFSEMAYSPVHEGVTVFKFPACIRQLFVLIRNAKKLRSLKLDRPHF